MVGHGSGRGSNDTSQMQQNYGRYSQQSNFVENYDNEVVANKHKDLGSFKWND